jgi:hypothetical protein
MWNARLFFLTFFHFLLFFGSYLNNLGITSVMLVAGGCLTRKRTQQCLAVLALCLAVFVDLFHFLLRLLLLVSFVSYFLLLKGVRFITFCYCL